jgi:hypothetical protein
MSIRGLIMPSLPTADAEFCTNTLDFYKALIAWIKALDKKVDILSQRIDLLEKQEHNE